MDRQMLLNIVRISKDKAVLVLLKARRVLA